MQRRETPSAASRELHILCAGSRESLPVVSPHAGDARCITGRRWPRRIATRSCDPSGMLIISQTQMAAGLNAYRYHSKHQRMVVAD